MPDLRVPAAERSGVTTFVRALIGTLLSGVGVAFGLVFLLPTVALLVGVGATGGGPDTVLGLALVILASELGYALCAVVFLVATDRGFGYLELDPPDAGAVVLTGGATVLLLLVQFGYRRLARALSVPIETTLPADVSGTLLFLAFVPLALFVIGPAEELLFRGVIQRYLREVTGPRVAITLASLPFALYHAGNYAAYPPLGIALGVAFIFVLSLGFGALYEWTDTLWVPIAVHGLYDVGVAAVSFL